MWLLHHAPQTHHLILLKGMSLGMDEGWCYEGTIIRTPNFPRKSGLYPYPCFFPIVGYLYAPQKICPSPNLLVKVILFGNRMFWIYNQVKMALYWIEMAQIQRAIILMKIIWKHKNVKWHRGKTMQRWRQVWERWLHQAKDCWKPGSQGDASKDFALEFSDSSCWFFDFRLLASWTVNKVKFLLF